MPLAATKYTEILEELFSYFTNKTKIDELSFARKKREINQVPDENEKKHLLAWLYASAGKKDEAEGYFEQSVFDNSNSAMNYLTYLVWIRDYVKHKEWSCRLSEIFYDSKLLLKQALLDALLFNDIQNIDKFSNLSLRLLGDGESVEEDWINEVLWYANEFKMRTKISDDYLSQLSQIMVSILKQENIEIRSTEHFVSPIENTNSFIIYVECSNPVLLTELNFKLADELSEISYFDDKSFSCWFNHKEQKELVSCQ